MTTKNTKIEDSAAYEIDDVTAVVERRFVGSSTIGAVFARVVADDIDKKSAVQAERDTDAAPQKSEKTLQN